MWTFSGRHTHPISHILTWKKSLQTHEHEGTAAGYRFNPLMEQIHFTPFINNLGLDWVQADFLYLPLCSRWLVLPCQRIHTAWLFHRLGALFHPAGCRTPPADLRRFAALACKNAHPQRKSLPIDSSSLMLPVPFCNIPENKKELLMRMETWHQQ